MTERVPRPETLAAEELQLLRQVARGNASPRHSATDRIAQRLITRGDAVQYPYPAPFYTLGITDRGRDRLGEKGYF